jgi:hypothetical protein
MGILISLIVVIFFTVHPIFAIALSSRNGCHNYFLFTRIGMEAEREVMVYPTSLL